MGELEKIVIAFLRERLRPSIGMGIVFALLAAAALFQLVKEPTQSIGAVLTSRRYVLLTASEVAVVALLVAGYELYRSRRRPPPGQVWVAVGEFWGNSSVALEEGRGIRALIERALLTQAVTEDGIQLVGRKTAAVIRELNEAVAHGTNVLATLVIGGEVVMLGKTVRMHPQIWPIFDGSRLMDSSTELAIMTIALDDPDHMDLAESTAADVVLAVRALGHYSLRHFAPAIPLFDAIERKSVDVWRYLGAAAFRAQPPDLATVERASRAILATNAHSWSGWNMLGSALLFQEKLDDARTAILSAIEQTTSAIPRRNLAIVELQRNDISAAAAALEAAMQNAPDDVLSLLTLGEVYVAMGQDESAETTYRRALLEAPSNAMVHNLLGNFLTARGRFADAIVELEEAVRLKPDYAFAHNNLGRALAYHKRPVDAIAHLERALELKPDYDHALNNLGQVLLAMGKYDEAEQMFKRAVALNKQYGDPWNGLAMLYAATGRMKEAAAARRRFDKLKAMRPRGGNYRRVVGVVR